MPVHTQGEGGARFLSPLAEHLPSAPPLPNAFSLLLLNAFLTVERALDAGAAAARCARARPARGGAAQGGGQPEPLRGAGE
eukprot:COSAG01_NODE_389_length_17708_cov_111.404452_21_plen_81_part_00